uniref:LysR family transcriptional regulator n=1 Tax=[Lactobacillus] rogosae TaxID=706562 RepID=UPI003FEE728F
MHKILRKFLISICLAQYKKSAEQLFVSSQALSKVIKKIENELDILLFTRTSQGLMH